MKKNGSPLATIVDGVVHKIEEHYEKHPEELQKLEEGIAHAVIEGLPAILGDAVLQRLKSRIEESSHKRIRSL